MFDLVCFVYSMKGSRQNDGWTGMFSFPLKGLDRKMYDLVRYVYSMKGSRQNDGCTGIFTIFMKDTRQEDEWTDV